MQDFFYKSRLYIYKNILYFIQKT